MADPTEIQAAIDLLETDTELLHDIVHGPSSGAGSTVATESGAVPTVAKCIADIAVAIITGYAAGFVAVAANAAARALVTPAQLSQLLIQTDTKAIYYS